MFSKAKDSGSSEAAQTSSAPQSNKRPSKSNVPSIISSDMTVIGTLNATGDIQIDGKVEGDINTNSLTIGEKAVVNGEVRAEEAIVRGHVIGSIRARKVHLASTSHVEGDILHHALAVETGAFFEGNCRHSDDPLATEAPQQQQRQQPAPSSPSSRSDTPRAALSGSAPASNGAAKPAVASTPASQGSSPAAS